MGMWTNNDDIEDLVHPPSGGPPSQRIGGIILPVFFVTCGVLDLRSGHATLIGSKGSTEVSGDAATSLACAYIALGGFFHFHWFWGLHDSLWACSQTLKTLSLAAFLPCFLFTLYRVLGG